MANRVFLFSVLSVVHYSTRILLSYWLYIIKNLYYIFIYFIYNKIYEKHIVNHIYSSIETKTVIFMELNK